MDGSLLGAPIGVGVSCFAALLALIVGTLGQVGSLFLHGDAAKVTMNLPKSIRHHETLRMDLFHSAWHFIRC